MWCYCTPSSHHKCNATVGRIMCETNVEHCLIGRSGSKVTQSCWEWPSNLVCPDVVNQCYIVGTNIIQPVCCCKGPTCNSKTVTMVMNPYFVNQPTEPFTITTELPIRNSSFILLYIIFVALITIILSIIFFFVKRFYGYRNSECPKSNWDKINTENLELMKDNYFEKNLVDKCTKDKLIAHGRFGQVWSGKINLDKMDQTDIAIKIFSDSSVNRRSWENEALIYTILRRKGHPNILYCYGAEKVTLSINQEMWLVVQYHPIGSLWEYLKKYSISWEMLLCISQNIAAGLSHLHSFNESGTSSIAHRDIKSKNILLKANMSACIADFGLAICQRNYGTSITNIVGTYNYMAPEILEGSINLTILSFLPVDIFSMSLVFWELLNRCILPGMKTNNFIFAFEQIVGEKPSLDEMRVCVVSKKLRPEFNDSWCNFPGVMTYWETICECWDEDPDARLTSDCVKIRLEELIIAHNSVGNTNIIPII